MYQQCLVRSRRAAMQILPKHAIDKPSEDNSHTRLLKVTIQSTANSETPVRVQLAAASSKIQGLVLHVGREREPQPQPDHDWE